MSTIHFEMRFYARRNILFSFWLKIKLNAGFFINVILKKSSNKIKF